MQSHRSEARHMTRHVLHIALSLAVATSSGCALTRAELDIQVPQLGNPAVGPAVRILAVDDVRRFELDPDEPSTPSLKNGEINDPDLTSRAFARKRNAYGKALGDILLPPGRTVSDVVREVLTRAFREKGYRVVAEDDAGADQAVPVNVQVEQFWGWFTPGFWSVSVEFQSSVRVATALEGFVEDPPVTGYGTINCQIANTDAWVEVMTKGLDDLAINLEKRIPPA
jgi:hypothetical protein